MSMTTTTWWQYRNAKASKYGDAQPTASYTYDSEGNVTKSQDTIGSKSFQYNANNDVTKYTDANGQTYSNTYDGKNLVSSTDPAKVSEAKIYDANGNVLVSTKNIGMAENLLTNSGMERNDANGVPSHGRRSWHQTRGLQLPTRFKRKQVPIPKINCQLQQQ